MVKIPDHIDELINKHKTVDNVVRTVKSVHSEAYTALEKELYDDKGNIDIDRLDDSNYQDKATDSMMKVYNNAVAKYFNLQSDKDGNISNMDDIKQEQLYKTYLGITKSKLLSQIKKMGKNYTIEVHERTRNSLVQEIEDELKLSASGHIKDEHVDSLVDYLDPSGAIIDKNKIRKDEATALFSTFNDDLPLSTDKVRKSYGRANYLKEDISHYQDNQYDKAA